MSMRSRDEALAVVTDQVHVGTDKILQSPHVSEGPGRIANAPVPSIYYDDRGEIHRVRVGGKRMNLLFSKKKVMRSGYLHHNTTIDFVVSGRVEVWTLGTTKTEKTIYEAREKFEIKPYVPHILHFLEDTVLLEYWEPGEFRCWYYHPYRRLLDVQNALVTQSTGTMYRLVSQQDTYASNASSDSASNISRALGRFLWWSSGLIMGIGVAAVLSSHAEKRGKL